MIFSSVKNQKGIAMLMALMAMTLLGILIANLVYETEVYHRIVYNQLDQVRTRALAKSGLKLGLLQLSAAKKALSKGKQFNLDASLTDRIWQTPIILPAPVPKTLSPLEKKALEEFNTKLNLGGRVSTTITGESDRLNINQLVWLPSEEKPSTGGNNPSTPPPTTPTGDPKEKLKATREAYVEIVNEILRTKSQEDEAFRLKYSGVTGEIIIGNILAYIDPNTSMDGDNRPKEEYYSSLSPRPLSPKNAPLFNISELSSIKGIDDELANLLSQHFTTLITKGVNVNTVSPKVLAAIMPELSPTDIEKIVQRRSDDNLGGAFKSAEDFWKFLTTIGNFEQAKERLGKVLSISTAETAYRVSVQANSGNSTRAWLAYIGDLPPVATDPNSGTPNQNPGYSGGDPVTIPPAGGSNEKKTDTTKNDNSAPNIIYLKAD
jgi:type II secretory pathway component PulK